ncbi:MAG: hypothetical protein DYG94_00810 [Leptolyngbya sp. PLA3]|nr:hypothetical protein [Leptolyngbya sp. PL-A3]
MGIKSASTKKASTNDPYLLPAIVGGAVLVGTLPVLMGAILTLTPKTQPTEHRYAAQAAALGVSPVAIELGEASFRVACASCHGVDARGVPHLGKPLRNSAFVQSSTPEALLAVVERGRAPGEAGNTTGILMPARGGRTDLSDADLGNIIAYVRSLQEPAEAALFVASCSSCHGADGGGVEGLGKSLKDSEWVKGKSDDELLAFIKQGRPIWDAENTTGIDMPPKGGNPALTDDELRSIIKHIRDLQSGKESAAGAPAGSVPTGPEA